MKLQLLTNYNFSEIVQKVKAGGANPFRPKIPLESCNKLWLELMTECWQENPANRPTFDKVHSMLKAINGGRSVVV